MTKRNHQIILKNLQARIAPVWPLKNFVAVNPFMGFTDNSYSKTAELLNARGAISLTMPIPFYLNLHAIGQINQQDIRQALNKSGIENLSVRDFLDQANELQGVNLNENTCQYNLIDIASSIEGKDWNELLLDRTSFWASAYFDRHVSTWKLVNEHQTIFQAWKQDAEIDRTPEIMGLKEFRMFVKNLPDDHAVFIETFLSKLKLDEENTEAYLHAMLLKLNGWSSYFSGIDFHDQVYGENQGKLIEFLSILLAWENYFLNNSERKDEIRAAWYKNWNKGEPLASNKALKTALILQEALDFSGQRDLKRLLATPNSGNNQEPVKAQMAFCIDVRSEVYRRNLERINPQIETIGFAGFFGLPIKYRPLGHEEGKNQCPVLLPSSYVVKESCENDTAAQAVRKSKHQISQTWKKFKSGAISSFGFVSPLGLTYLPKIITDSFHLSRPVEDPQTDGISKYLGTGKTLDLSGISLNDKVKMAQGALTGMGIKDRLAPIVIITGHGSSSVNNPHASGLDCGACGGHSGEINALTAQYIFNDPEVREGLIEKGITIPKETIFVACLHNTTTDEIHFINESLIPSEHQGKIAELKTSLQKASQNTRTERALRLNVDTQLDKVREKKIHARAQDWSQVRPEWGLAGCHSIIIAPRRRTQNVNLNGKAFLHNYDHHTDTEFKILESIMTAPMLVTSWINLQYFASTVDNFHFGAGNKTLHNIVSGVGVIEGSGGDLRIGLPQQSIQNGSNLEHIPMRLNVVIEAPINAINRILQEHESIRQLFDHNWIYLHRMNNEGNISNSYVSNMKWNKVKEESYKQINPELQTV